ncbi:glycosyltransferase family 4 protein [Dyella japonica]|uniref:Group 1 glycosyl transferase n=1 Tax=Dyella japonica A8 TaxID=1217721 RepID=A0A075JYT3_9GAMM|nr:glycosyltransferase family 4 protein [Dyella japonica]AIF47256.1 group 1 glycosyl transferase [Dyella japonica A8]
MRIAFLCKRRYMGKDVVLDRYARLYEIPFQLARLGHTVHAFCLSYQGHDEGDWTHDAHPGKLTWHSRSLGKLVIPGLARYPSWLLHQLRQQQPDILIGASDIPQIALGAWLSRKLAVPYVVDLYDNFEGFGQARIPGMVASLRRAVRNAALVTTTSEPLRQLIEVSYRAKGHVMAMPSTVDKDVFHPYDKQASRRELGLPEDAVLIGTAGGLYQDKGIATLYEAWPRIARDIPTAHLVLAGPHDQAPPAGDRVHYLGQLPHGSTAKLFNALDVGVVYLRDTPFGRFCFPQKAYEMMACDLPLVAARVGVMPDLLGTVPSCLYEADSAHDLARAIREQASSPRRAAVSIDDWAQIIGRMNTEILRIASCD